MLKYYSTKQKRKLISNIVIYSIFVGMVFYYAVLKSSNKSFSIFLIVLAILAIAGCLYYEYLNWHYVKVLYILNLEIDPKKALGEFEKLIKIDFTNTYKRDRALVDVAIYSAMKDEEKVIDIIDKNDERFRSSIEMLVVRNYYLMKAYLSFKDYDRVEALYQDIKAVEKMKKHPEPIPLNIYHGYHYIAVSNMNKAYDAFKEIDRTKLNPKEQKEVLERLIETSKKEAQKEKYRKELSALPHPE